MGYLNDLWKYSTGEWTWIGGSNAVNKPGMYGTQNTAAPSNVPGARQLAVSWADATGNFWLFGGQGYDSAGALDELNDLWKYNAGEWTWMGGSNVVNQPGTYGTQGIAAPSNVPGARQSAVSWADAAGDIWLFGGLGCTSPGTGCNFNDLWKYSADEWTWMGGSNEINQTGTYGTQGTAAPNNVPGGRRGAAGWIDAAGNLWLFGGYGEDSAGSTDYLNDLWKCNP
jgi:N-acetylneuraminic acid mutarotase